MATPPALTPELKQAYDAGFAAALDRRRVYVDFATEKAMPLEWAEYTNEEERNIIASIVAMPEFQEFFKRNLMCQAQLKWRQARLAKDPEAMRLCLEVGNFVMELVAFYDHSGDNPILQNEETDGFSGFPEPK